MLVERRIAGIIRWLERLKQSYSSGAMESALMDAECARADLEDLRQAVWSQVKPSEHRVGIFTRILSGLRTVSLAVIIVLLAVVPLSRELPAPIVELDKSDIVMAEPIIIVREEDPVTEAVAPSRTASAQPVKKAASQKRKTSAKRPQAKPDTNSEPAGTVPYDKVYSLIQTGQRALKNNTSVIKIQ